NASQAVFAPAVGAGAGLVVTEVIPGVAALAVVLAHRSPLAFTEIRAPLPPRSFRIVRLCQPDLFCIHRTPAFESKGYIEHAFVMFGNRLKIRFLARLERLTMFPGVFEGGDEPEIAIGVA